MPLGTDSGISTARLAGVAQGRGRAFAQERDEGLELGARSGVGVRSSGSSRRSTGTRGPAGGSGPGRDRPPRVVPAGRPDDVEVVGHRVLQPGEAAVVEEGRPARRGCGAARCGTCSGPPGSPVNSSRPKSSSALGPEDAKLPVPTPKTGGDLGDAEGVHREVAEHLIRRPRDGVAPDATGLAEEQQRPPFLPVGHRPMIAARIGRNRALSPTLKEKVRENAFDRSMRSSVMTPPC